MSRKQQQPLGPACAGLLLCLLLVPAYFLYWVAARGYRVDEDAVILAAAARKRAAIDEALQRERAERAALEQERAQLRRKVAQTSERALERLRREVAERRDSLSDLDRLLLDESIGIEEIIERRVRAALPELERVEFSLVKGYKKFELVVDLSQLGGVELELADPDADSAEGSRAPNLGPLAAALSELPGHEELRRWAGNLHLAREGAHRYPQRFLPLSEEAWRELLAAYLEPFQTSFTGTSIDNLYGKRAEPSLSQLNVELDASVAAPHTLTIVGPQRIEGRVAPGETFSCELQPGAYVVRSQATEGDELGFLSMVEFEQRRKVDITFKPRPR